MFDFCYHILNVEEAMPIGGDAKDVRCSPVPPSLLHMFMVYGLWFVVCGFTKTYLYVFILILLFVHMYVLQQTIYGFLPNAGQARDINHLIFSVLSVFHPLTHSNILILHPPKQELGTEFINHSASDLPIESAVHLAPSVTTPPFYYLN